MTFYRPDPDNPGMSIECEASEVSCENPDCAAANVTFLVASWGGVWCGTCGAVIREYGMEGPHEEIE